MRNDYDRPDKPDFWTYCFNITLGLTSIIVIMILMFIAAFLVYGALVAVHRVAWGMI